MCIALESCTYKCDTYINIVPHTMHIRKEKIAEIICIVSSMSGTRVFWVFF